MLIGVSGGGYGKNDVSESLAEVDERIYRIDNSSCVDE